MTNVPRRRADDSGLINLMEAATALTQLVEASSTSTVKTSVTSKADQHPVRDNGGMVSPDDSATVISALRQNHLKALQAASLEARPVETTIASQQNGASTGNSAVRDKETFPMRLHALLADSSVRDVVSWLSHGNSFVILRPDVFADQVLPRYFNSDGSSNGTQVHKYPSFTRKLNRWGFRQIARGADAGAFCHELFRRDTPERCRDMVCQKSRKIRDDNKSVSSASTMSMKSGISGQKRSVCDVTVSTSGKSSRSLPLKKRRGVATYESGIPVKVEMKPNNTSLVPPISSDSDTVSDLSLDVTVSSGGAKASSVGTTTSGVEQRTHSVYEQQRAFALAALMENSRKAMLAAGIDIKSGSDKALTSSSLAVVGKHTESRVSTTNSKALASTVPSTTQSCSSQVSLNAAAAAAAEAAKHALFEAYKQALSSSS